MTVLNLRNALILAFALALFSAGAMAAGNAARGIEPATDAASCAQLVSDTKEILEETEVSATTDQTVEGLISTATAQCAAGQFQAATETVVQARALLTQD